MKSITEVMEDIVKPYIDTQNQALTNYTADTGVKNLHDVSGSEISGVYGVTVTRLSKGYKLESTMSGSWSHAYFSQKLEKNTDYVLTTDITFSSGLGAIYIYGKVTGGSNVEIKHIDNINASGSKTIEFNSGNYDEYQIYLSITGTPSATGNITFDNFMVRDATITDPTYQPYAKTNVELTADVSEISNHLKLKYLDRPSDTLETVLASLESSLSDDSILNVGIRCANAATSYGYITKQGATFSYLGVAPQNNSLIVAGKTGSTWSFTTK